MNESEIEKLKVGKHDKFVYDKNGKLVHSWSSYWNKWEKQGNENKSA